MNNELKTENKNKHDGLTIKHSLFILRHSFLIPNS
jgi:hypothetical protein